MHNLVCSGLATLSKSVKVSGSKFKMKAIGLHSSVLASLIVNKAVGLSS